MRPKRFDTGRDHARYILGICHVGVAVPGVAPLADDDFRGFLGPLFR